MAVSRRALVLGGLGLVVASGSAGAAVLLDKPAPVASPPPPASTIGTTSSSVRTTTVTSPPSPTAVAQPVTIRKFVSKARGQEVTAITMAPEGYKADDLPKCIALHGRGGDANWMVDLGVPKFLTDAVRNGVPAFAVISVDGGRDSYWTAKDSTDDPQKMLAEELGPIQAAFGISMGAFGSLVFARRRRDLKAVAVASPALFKTWGDANSRHVFASQAVWEANEPLRHTEEIANTPLGVWCGTKDPFISVAQALVDQAKPAHTAIGPGAHDNEYWQRVLPEMIAFIGERMK
jgi:hypothetical protein